jgi:hypothetical protein
VSIRILHSSLYAINIILFSTYVYFATAKKLTAMVGASAIFLSSMFILSLHAMAWSEPLFITLTFTAFLFHSKYLQTQKRVIFWLSCFCISMAIVTRYLGITLLPPVIISIFIFSNRSFKHKIIDTILMLSIALVPITTWIIRNALVAQTLTDRSWNIHIVGVEHCKEFFHTLNMLILPASISEWRKEVILVVIVVLFIAGIVTLWIKQDSYIKILSNQQILPFISIFFSLEYLFVIIISLSFFDANTPLDTRILLPMFLFLIASVISLAWFVAKSLNKKFIWKYFLFILYILIGLNLFDATAEAINTHYNGKRFNALKWRQSSILKTVKSFRNSITIYSNEPTLINFQTHKYSYPLPTHIIPCTNQINNTYHQSISKILHQCQNGTAVIVFFKTITWKKYMISNDEIKINFNLNNIAESKNAVIYGKTALLDKE